MKPNVYIETTIISYLVARPTNDVIASAHQLTTQVWWENRRNDFTLYVSSLVRDEAERGNPEAAARRLAIVTTLPELALSSETIELAQLLIHHGALPAKAADDALHISIAAVYEIEYLLTWNLKHIANAEKQRSIELLVTSLGYAMPTICTPEELMGG